MNFNITDGTGKIRIGVNGNSFSFLRPLTFCWPDNRGSIGRYLCALPFSEAYRNEVHRSVTANLNMDFSRNTAGLYEILQPLFRLFPNGEYALTFHNAGDKDLFSYQTSGDSFRTVHTGGWELHFGKLTRTEEEKKRRLEHLLFLIKNAITKKHYPSGLLEHTTYSFYPGFDTFFLATQPEETIDWARVAYFEKEIAAGARPFAIVYSCMLYDAETGHSIDPDYFIIDGHHKLLAYHNLKLYPPVACLTFLPKHRAEVTLDFNDLKGHLYSWQLRHIAEHGIC